MKAIYKIKEIEDLENILSDLIIDIVNEMGAGQFSRELKINYGQVLALKQAKKTNNEKGQPFSIKKSIKSLIDLGYEVSIKIEKQ
ncbi:MAG: hypothetical protein ACRCST_11585 [Turicibacter sp.]